MPLLVILLQQLVRLLSGKKQPVPQAEPVVARSADPRVGELRRSGDSRNPDTFQRLTAPRQIALQRSALQHGALQHHAAPQLNAFGLMLAAQEMIQGLCSSPVTNWVKTKRWAERRARTRSRISQTLATRPLAAEPFTIDRRLTNRLHVWTSFAGFVAQIAHRGVVAGGCRDQRD